MSTITFTCYACNQVLKVAADKAGKKAKCVKCGTILTIPVSAGEAEVATPAAPQPPPASRPPAPPPAPARRSDFDFEEPPPPPRRARRDDAYEEPPPRRPRREDDYDDAPPRRRPREDDDYDAPRRRPRDDYDDDYDRRPGRKWGDWSKVQVGFLLNSITGGMLTGYAGLTLLALLLLLIGINAMSPGMLQTALVLTGIAGIINFLLQVVAVIAFVFCIFAPAKNGALALAITCLALASVSLILKMIYVLIPAFRSFSMGGLRGLDGPGPGPGSGGFPVIPNSLALTIMLAILFILLYYAEYVIASLFIRAVGKCRKDRYLMSGAMASLVMACIVIGLQVLSLILGVALASGGMGRGTFTVIMIMGILAAGIVAAFGIVYMRVNLQARNATA